MRLAAVPIEHLQYTARTLRTHDIQLRLLFRNAIYATLRSTVQLALYGIHTNYKRN